MSDRKLLDAELMKQVAAGDQSACRSLVEQHLRGLVGLSYRMLSDMAAAEDVAQETFLRLWRTANRWKPEARISTWLYHVAHNVAIDEIRRRGHMSDQEAPDTPDPSANQYAAQHQTQVADQVEAALVQLPVRQRTAITLVHHQELSNIEAAEIMEISVDALESLLARGRRKLKELLIDRRRDLVGEME